MNTFKTLMLREWMQHHRGWLWLSLVPLGLAVLGLGVGEVVLDGTPDASLLLALAGPAYAWGMLLMAVAVVMFQAPGLARRDTQDRSIEFWLSLPVTQLQAVGATLLTQLWLLPLFALGMGLLGGLVVGPLVGLKVLGWGLFAEVSWGPVLWLWLLAALRLALGLVLGMLWLAPVLLLAMAASAWLKRWGVPVLGLVLGGGAALLSQVYGLTFLLNTLTSLWERFTWALIPWSQSAQDSRHPSPPLNQLPDLARWLGLDMQQQLLGVFSPWLAVVLLGSALGVGLLVLRRQRAG